MSITGLISKAESTALKSVDDIRPWLQKIQELLRRLRRMGDQKSIKSLTDQRKKLKEMLVSLGVGVSTKKTANGMQLFGHPLG